MEIYVSYNHQKKAGITILRLDKVEYKTRDIIRYKHNDKKVNSLRRQNNPKCVCTQQKNFKIHEAKLTQLKGEKSGISTPLYPYTRQKISKDVNLS